MSKSPGPNSIVSTGIRVNACIASHISNDTRLKFFLLLLDSIKIQSRKPTQILLGLSGDKKYQDKVKEKLQVIGIPFQCNFSDTARSQFENYQSLLPFLDKLDAREDWLLFSDDDDVWSKYRI